MTQLDIERATAVRYGTEGRVQAQQVSRIEKGNVDKPPILDLLRIGEVLGLKPDDIAEMFGLWERQTDEPQPDPRVREFLALVEQVPFDLREDMLTQLEVVVALTRAKLRSRLAAKSAQETGAPEATGATRETEEAPDQSGSHVSPASQVSKVRLPRPTKRGRPPMHD